MADKPAAPQEPADTYHRHGDLDPSGWEEQNTVTDRPNDLEIGGKAPANSTFGDRAKTTTKQVEPSAVEDKSIKRSVTKRRQA